MEQQNKGVTLAEVLIALVLSSIVIGFSLQIISEMTKNYIYSRQTTDLQTESRSMLLLMSRDLSSMGYKTILEDTEDGNTVVRQLRGTWTGNLIDPTNPADSSASFLHYAGLPYDKIEIFKAEMVRDDELDQILRVMYEVNSDGILSRSSRIFDTTTETWSAPVVMEIGNNIEALQYRYTTDGINWHDDPTGIRDQVEEVRIELLVRSNRAGRVRTEKRYTVGNLVFSTTDESRSQFKWRFYQETLEVTNNGIVF